MPRTCGSGDKSCTACCKTHAVPELKKPMGVWCSHCSIGKGCTIYQERPLSCRKFKCVWLRGVGSLHSRPDKTGVVMSLWHDSVFFKQIILEAMEVEPGALRRSKEAQTVIEEMLQKRTSVFISTAGQEKGGMFVLAHGKVLPYYVLPVLLEQEVKIFTPKEYRALG